MILSRKRDKFNKQFLEFPQNYKKQLCRRKNLQYFDSNETVIIASVPSVAVANANGVVEEATADLVDVSAVAKIRSLRTRWLKRRSTAAKLCSQTSVLCS